MTISMQEEELRIFAECELQSIKVGNQESFEGTCRDNLHLD